MPTAAPHVPGEGVIVYSKSDRSDSHKRIRNFTRRQKLNARFEPWNDLCDLQVGLGSLIDPTPRDAGKFTEQDFRVATNIVKKNTQVETLTFYRRGDIDGNFLNAYDEDLLTLGEEMSV